jgi:hypothetical protein
MRHILPRERERGMLSFHDLGLFNMAVAQRTRMVAVQACHGVHTKPAGAIGIVTWRAVKGLPMIGLEPSVAHGQTTGQGSLGSPS